MTTRHLNLLCAGGLILGAFSGTAWPEDACCPDGTKAACCSSVSDAAQTVASKLSLPLRGLKDATQESFTRAMRSIGRDRFECAGHPEATRDAPSTCDACGGAALTRRHVPAFRSMVLEVSGMAQTCRVELAPGETVRLSSITSALEDCDVSLDPGGLRLGDGARLYLAGLTCTGCEGKATAALQKIEGVAGSSCTFGTSEESLATMDLGASGAMEYERIAKSVADAGFRLADVSWSGPLPTEVSWTEAEEAEPELTYDLGITGFAKRLGERAEPLIHGLVPGGAAEKAGLKEGDRIVTINGGVAFEFTREELTELMEAPEAISFEIERGDEAFTIEIAPEAVTCDEAERAYSAKEKPSKGLPLGKAAPAVVGEDLDGIPFELADYRGKVTVVSFWGFW